MREKYQYLLKKKLKKLENIEYSRSNSEWFGRAMIGGKVNKSRTNLMLTSNYLKIFFKLELNDEEFKTEQNFRSGKTK